MLTIPLYAISLQSTVGNLYLLLGVVLLVLLSLFSYRYTRPPLPRAGRIALAILRMLALIAVWLLVIQFGVHWSFERPVKSRIAILVDRSESMALRDGTGDRQEVLSELLSLLPEGEFAERVEWEYYSFSERLERLASHQLPTPDGPVTDLNRTLLDVATLPEGTPDALILFSDGAVNRGGPPTAGARELGVPIYAVAIGDSLPPRDLVISSLNSSDKGYVGEVLPVDATLRATGMQGQQAEVRLLDENGSVIERKQVAIDGEWSEKTVQFEVTPDRAGINSWRIEVWPAEGEVDSSNNIRRTTVRAAERRRSVLLFAGAPNPDAAALARTLEHDSDTQLTVLIGGGTLRKPVRGSYSDATDLTAFDVVLITLHRSFSNESLALLSALADSGLPMMIITGDEPDREALRVLDARVGGVETHRVSDNGIAIPAAFHAIFTPEQNWFEDGAIPPPLTLPPFVSRDGLTIATAGINGEGRTILSSTSSPRTLAWFAGGLWRWDLGRRSDDPSGIQFLGLLDRILLYLSTPEDEERVHLKAEQDQVSGGEEARLFLEVRDESGRPVENARVTALVNHTENERTVEFRSAGGGRYSAAVAPWGEGRYEVSAEVRMDGETIVRETDFMVDPFHLESAELRMRPDRLRSLAQATGGTFLQPTQIDSLPELLPLEEGVEEITGTWRPFGLWLTLLLIVGLLAVEWIARTRTGML